MLTRHTKQGTMRVAVRFRKPNPQITLNTSYHTVPKVFLPRV